MLGANLGSLLYGDVSVMLPTLIVFQEVAIEMAVFKAFRSAFADCLKSYGVFGCRLSSVAML